MKKFSISLAMLVAASVTIVSCGGYNSSSSTHKLSGLKFRAFVSNPLFNGSPDINIVDATKDVLSTAAISLLGAASQPQLMAVSPDLHTTMVFSPSGNTIALVDNTTEGLATTPANSSGQTSQLGAIVLPGLTESMFVAKNNFSAYAAVPNAAVSGQPPGAVVAMDIEHALITATIPVPAAHFIVPSPDGTHILVFSDDTDSVTIIDVALIGTDESPLTTVAGFDRPVWAIFTDSVTAYIFNSGPERGGAVASVATFTIGDAGPTKTVPVSGATYGLLNGNTLYVAGTPPGTKCPAGTAATACGKLNILDASSLQVTNASPILITDGFHTRMQMGSNGQLFIGAQGCTSINVLGGEVRGCLSIFNTNTGKVIVPPDTGDATGIQPISGRNVVYVCEGGVFRIYDTTTDQLLVQPNVQIDIVGQSYDVKLVDPPLN